MSPAPHRPERAPPSAGAPHPSAAPAMLPPAHPVSRSFVFAAARLRALHLDPLLTNGDQPLPRKGIDDPEPV